MAFDGFDFLLPEINNRASESVEKDPNAHT